MPHFQVLSLTEGAEARLTGSFQRLIVDRVGMSAATDVAQAVNNSKPLYDGCPSEPHRAQICYCTHMRTSLIK